MTVGYQSLCCSFAGASDNCSNHASTASQSYITSALINDGNTTYLPSKLYSVGAPKSVLAKAVCALLGTDIVIIGEYFHTGVQVVPGYNYVDSIIADDNINNEQRGFSVFIRAGCAVSVTNINRPPTTRGAISLYIGNSCFVFVHIPHDSTDSASMREYMRLCANFSNKSVVVMGDTNEGRSGRIDNVCQFGAWSVKSQGFAGDTSTGGGSNAYHDTIITNCNMVSGGRWIGRNLADRPTVYCHGVTGRLVSSLGKLYTVSDHHGVACTIDPDDTKWCPGVPSAGGTSRTTPAALKKLKRARLGAVRKAVGKKFTGKLYLRRRICTATAAELWDTISKADAMGYTGQEIQICVKNNLISRVRRAPFV